MDFLDPDIVKAFDNSDSAVRYWAAMGVLMREEKAVKKTRLTLLKALLDDSPSVRVIAAQALGQYGGDGDAVKALDVLLELADVNKNSVFVAMLAINGLDAMGGRAAGVKGRIAGLPKKAKRDTPRVGNYVGNLLRKVLADLD